MKQMTYFTVFEIGILLQRFSLRRTYPSGFRRNVSVLTYDSDRKFLISRINVVPVDHTLSKSTASKIITITTQPMKSGSVWIRTLFYVVSPIVPTVRIDMILRLTWVRVRMSHTQKTICRNVRIPIWKRGGASTRVESLWPIRWSLFW